MGAVQGPGRLTEREPWQQVRRAREFNRPTTLDYINLALDASWSCTATEHRGVPGDGRGLAVLGDMPIAVVGQQRGHTPAELAKRNFSMPAPAG